MAADIINTSCNAANKTSTTASQQKKVNRKLAKTSSRCSSNPSQAHTIKHPEEINNSWSLKCSSTTDPLMLKEMSLLPQRDAWLTVQFSCESF